MDKSKVVKVVEGITLVKGKHTFAKIPKHITPKEKEELKKDRKKMYNKKYYEKNAEKMSEYHAKRYAESLSVKIKCPNCGREVSKQRFEKHKLTKLCQRRTEMINWVKEE